MDLPMIKRAAAVSLPADEFDESPVTVSHDHAQCGGDHGACGGEVSDQSDGGQEGFNAQVLQEHNQLHEYQLDEPDPIDPEAEEVDLTNTRQKDLSLVYKLKHCTSLTLRQNDVSSLELLLHPDCGLSTLTSLDLYANALKTDELRFVSKLTKLKLLDLSFSDIRDVPTGILDRMTELKDLYLVNTKLTAVPEGVASLTTLTQLELGSNRIREISNLEHLTNLTELWLGRNKLTKIQGLDSLVKLQKMSIQSNRLVAIEGLSKLQSLRELYLSHNGLMSLDGLQDLVSLRILDVSANRIKKLQGLERLTNLEELWLNNNFISSLEDLKCVQGAKGLVTLYLERNPVQQEADYEDTILKMLPTLTQLDASMYEDIVAVGVAEIDPVVE